MNHPALADDPVFRAELLAAALNKPSNSDVYTVAMARFVDTFARVLGDPALPHLFFVEGGALAVENALKVAFDWKSRWNEAHGLDPALGTRVLHLREAFHGRTGYTLSLTNTDPVKTARFPQFDWPRIDNPYLAPAISAASARPGAGRLRRREAFAAHPHDIACFDRRADPGRGRRPPLPAEFLQAMQRLCHEHDALFVVDEVQTGCGITGTAWAYQQLGLTPDVVAFGKKTQVCGVMAGGRVDEVPDNVFAVSSRINSTWGGGLTDMVRARRILEVIEADGLIPRAAALGRRLLALLRNLAGATRRDRPAGARADVRGHAGVPAAARPGRRAAAHGRARPRAGLRHPEPAVPPGADGHRAGAGRGGRRAGPGAPDDRRGARGATARRARLSRGGR